ncbi:adenosylcobinamide-GDP ribazoletransferase [Curvibacter sp. APW13]|uniref:adenosylcobinamide-GDP ribazoletransferase n=1 Tax=Curvibacter sp. APW13 TaxID=3077236 RepID=UPI0028DDDDCC|nr:adenosylcobinamide-GDP ribazoletransferase [Curvibacter sp. APW13]MDT8991762.1 adenosylcobinamide-GDP ribazoletransferase [Curvibacter sp. APW13]
MQPIRHYLLAVQFFTRIPVTGRLAEWVGYSPAMLRASAAHLPGIGVLVGGLVALLSWGMLQALPPGPFSPLVVAVLGTVFTVLLTGGFHEDGLADVADGLGGSYDRNRALEIMKDSRVGAFGAMALVLALLSKVSLLALLGSHGASLMALALLAAHAVSRTWPLLVIRLLPHVGDVAGSKSKPLADQISLGALAAGFLWCFCLVAGVFIAWPAMVSVASAGCVLGSAVAGSALAAAAMAWRLQRRLQGFTGDGLGATQQLGEIGFYLGLALAL